MIGFFRRIRKKLADDNQFIKYSRYAIGEIVLVVIGILIALQINNWNQNRSKAQKEKIMLIELKENLEFNIERFQSAISWEEDRIKGIKKILEYIENEKPWNDTIQYEIKQFRLIEEFHISTSAYQSLSSNGFDLISSDNLRKELIKLYDGLYQRTEKRVSEYGRVIYQSREDYYNETFKYDDIKKRLILNNSANNSGIKKFENMLSLRLHFKENVIRLDKACIIETEALIKLIDNEL